MVKVGDSMVKASGITVITEVPFRKFKSWCCYVYISNAVNSIHNNSK